MPSAIVKLSRPELEAKKCQLLISAAYVLVGAQLAEFGLIEGDTWGKVKHLPNADEMDHNILDIWTSVLQDAVRPIPLHTLKSNGKIINGVIADLPEHNEEGNQLLMGVHLLSFWINECAGIFIKATYKPRIDRFKFKLIKRVEDATNQGVVQRSFSSADNIRRALSGKAMLDVSLRSKQADRIRRKLGVKNGSKEKI